MSTANGAILCMGTVWSHNVTRQLDHWWPKLITPDNLLLMARLSTIPFVIASACIGSFYRSSKSSGATGYLLIVAFDIVLATVVPILFGAFYVKNPSPRAAFLSVCTGAVCRIVLEFTLPKDGYLILPFQYEEFLKYGVSPSEKYPLFFDAPVEEIWDPTTQPCEQEYYDDYTGTDSLASFFAAAFVFLCVQTIENRRGRALFDFRGLQGYVKDTEGANYEDAEMEKGVPVDVTDGLEVTTMTVPVALTDKDVSSELWVEKPETAPPVEGESEESEASISPVEGESEELEYEA